jgi:putative radical SAM enzyme (TIGR03279 family)
MIPAKKRRVALAPEQSGVIASVAPGSLAEEIGLVPGQRVVSINGSPLNDAIDFQFEASNEDVTIEVDTGDGLIEYQVERELDEPWGITFADPTFDGIHICENTCPFCFIKQLPKGMRKSLYVMDDDYRYSMLYGNFVTLTNLTEDDWRRIEDQHISPINVSVHATNPDLRVALVGNPKGALILEHLARLERAGIEYNTQVVLCPGINDGAELDRTIDDLSECGPHSRSIAVVPVGLSKFGVERQSRRVRLSRTCMRTLPGATLDIRRFEQAEAEAVIEQVESWQRRFRRERSRTFVFLGDEFYLMTGRAIPPTATYDGFPQVEDGIGITRLFIDDVDRLIRRTPAGTVKGRSGTIACGMLIADTMNRLVDRLNAHTGANLRVVPIVNEFFGDQINVSGLLTGGLVRDALINDDRRDPVFVSEHMLSKRTQTFLDDMHIEELQESLGRQVVSAGYLSEVLRHLNPHHRAA